MGRPLLHVPVIGAASAVLYATTLGAVAFLQSSQDVALRRETAPLQQAADRATLRAEEARRALTDAGRALATAGERYAATTQRAADVDDVLQELAARVEAVSGSAATLPRSVPLPAAPAPVILRAAPPPADATTGASGR